MLFLNMVCLTVALAFAGGKGLRDYLALVRVECGDDVGSDSPVLFLVPHDFIWGSVGAAGGASPDLDGKCWSLAWAWPLAMDSLKFTAVSGVARPQGRWPAAHYEFKLSKSL
jgi:hypothetical protein